MNDTDDTAVRAAAGAGYTREWALFCDYTAATDQPTLPTTVAALRGFLTQIPARPATQARRIAAIAAAHRNTGHLGEHAAALRSATTTESSLTASLQSGPTAGELVTVCATRGWPSGLTGRRDAYLIVLVTVLGYTHTAARRIHPADLTSNVEQWSIAGRPVPTDTDPRACPTCALVRWLDILGTADGLGRGSARAHLTAATAPTAHGPHQHTPPDPPRWHTAAQLLPAIDRHGWIDDYQPLSTRGIRTRLTAATTRANQLTTPASPASTVAASPATGPRTPPTPADLAEVLHQLDQVAHDADTLNARIEALLRL